MSNLTDFVPVPADEAINGGMSACPTRALVARCLPVLGWCAGSDAGGLAVVFDTEEDYRQFKASRGGVGVVF